MFRNELRLSRRSQRALLGVLGSILFLSCATTLEAQLNRGIIEGTVTDPRGAIVPDVNVLITAVDTNVAQTIKTNAAGYYRAVDLVPGKYRVQLAAAGFTPVDITAIEVTAGQVVRVDNQLTIKSATEVVSITAEVPLVQTGASNFATTLSSDLIQNIPLAGRDLQQLVFLIPGVNNVGGPPGSNFGFNSEFGTSPDPTHLLGSAISVNGGQGGANAWYLDGNLNVSNFGENIVINPTPDVVSEFQVITSAFSAEYGQTGGGVFNVVLKSGTNAVHGDLYEYLRNDATNARNPFTQIGAPQTAIRFNNFGGTVGGPLVIPHLYNGKNKTFFYFSMDATILHQSAQQLFSVPTPLMRTGDFSEIASVASGGLWQPNSTTSNGLGGNTSGNFQRTAYGTPVAGNPFGANGCLNTSVEAGASAATPFQTCNFSSKIPSLDPVAMFFVNSFPLPNHIDSTGNCPLGAGAFSICSNFLGPAGNSLDTINYTLKIDHQTSEKSRYFAEWLYSPTKNTNFKFPWSGPTFPVNTSFSGPYNFTDHNVIIALGHTYIFSPTLINEFRGSFSRQNLDTHPNHPYPDSVTGQTAVVAELAPVQLPTHPLFPSPSFDIGGGLYQFGPAPWVNLQTAAEAYTILDNVTRIIGKHTLKTGFLYRIDHGNYNGSSPTIMPFNGGLTSDPVTGLGGSALAQFELGAFQNGNNGCAFTGSFNPPYLRWRRWGFYLQDDYRVTSNFTLNLGLRYDLNGYFRTRYQPMGNFCFTCMNPLTGLKGTAIYSGGRGFPKGDLAPANHKSFGPRVNFAWSPRGSRKTVIRGGYDIFYSDALQNLNAPGQSAVNGTGWSRNGAWAQTFAPFSSQCQNYGGGNCVAFPLSDTTTDKATLVTPAIITSTNGLLYPAQTRENTLGAIYSFNKPNIDPMVQTWTLEVQRELPGNLGLSVAYVGSHGTHLAGIGPNGYIFNQLPTKDVLAPANGVNGGQQDLNNVNVSLPVSGTFAAPVALPLSGTGGAGTAYSFSAAQVALLAQVFGNPTTGLATSLPLAQLLRPYPFFQYTNGIDSNGTFDGLSIYHAMNVRLEKHYSHGLNVIAAYTFSKKIVNWSVGDAGVNVVDSVHFFRGGVTGGRGGALVSTFGGASPFQDPDHKSADRGLSVDDIPHMLNIGATYELPVGSGKALLNHKGILNGILGGWKLSGNFNAQSGLPLAINCPADNAQSTLSAGGVGRCNLIGDPHFKGHRTKAQREAQWINPAAFEPAFGSDQTFWANYTAADPRAWLLGNAAVRGAGGIRSPGYWNVDNNLSKQFHLTEAKYFEFHWDLFNTLNHQNLGLPSTSFCLPVPAGGTPNSVQTSPCNFGQITTVQTDPRAMEFALKFYF